MNLPSVRPYKLYVVFLCFLLELHLCGMLIPGVPILTRALADTQKNLRLTKMKKWNQYLLNAVVSW